MFVAVLAHHSGQRMHAFLAVGMVQAPWQTYDGQADDGTPRCGRCGRRDPQVGHAQRLFDSEVIHLDGPALVEMLRMCCADGERGPCTDNTAGVCPEDAVC